MSKPLTALFGAPLLGDKWLKQIHVDEAGTSRWDRIAVVAAVIIDGDRDFRRAEEKIGEAIKEHIPSDMQEGFVFHAKDVFGKLKKERGWEIEKCYEITEAWLKVIVDLSLPFVTAWAAKPEHIIKNDRPYYTENANMLAHVTAFLTCFLKCDEYLAEFCQGEVGSLLAEDVPSMKRTLNTMRKALVKGHFSELEWLQKHPISHIKNAIQWCDKDDAVLLQLADACAFSFKRYITCQKGGDRLYSAMINKPEFSINQDWTNSPGGFVTTFWR